MFRKFLAASLGIVVLCLTAPTYGQLLVSSAEFVVPRQTFENSVSNLREVEVAVPILDGGGVTGSINSNNFIVVTGSGQQAAGIDIVSGEGLLVPIADGTAAPFAFLLSNTNNQVTFGSLGSTVTLEGDLVTSVGYTGTNPISDISASWGRGAEPVPFSVLPIGGAETIRVKTAFNLIDGQVVDYANAAYRGTIEAGSATGLPPDTPLDRVDPNNATAMFPGVGSLQVVHPTLGTFICTGSVIDDTHVLTAGHCFDLDNDGAVDAGVTAGTTFYLNDNGTPSATRTVSAVAIHPDFGGFSTSGANDDLAVVTLSSIVPPGTTTYPIRASGMSSGEVIEMVGYGISGQGDVGGIEVLPDLGVKRSGENEVDLFVVDDEGSGLDEIYIYDFDGPTGDGFLGGGTIGNDRETVVRGGDSGGPALVEVNGLPAIAGVNTFEFVLLGTTPPTGEFGVLGGGVLIDAPQFAWISSIATGATQAVVPEPSGLFTTLSSLFALGFLRRRKSQ